MLLGYIWLLDTFVNSLCDRNLAVRGLAKLDICLSLVYLLPFVDTIFLFLTCALKCYTHRYHYSEGMVVIATTGEGSTLRTDFH